MTPPPLIYNLFPRLVGPTTRWPEHAERAARMGFNWLYLNPWHYPGFSGSLYAPKEFSRLNPAFLPAGADAHGLEPLREAVARIAEAGTRPMMDLVVNHTSKDCPLVREHPEWYVRDPRGEVVSPFVVDPDDPTKKTVWGDLAEIDNEGSPDREGLWAFWAERVREGLELGFHGFRCDAAYKVPSALWRYLIEEARRVRPDAQFFAETLGAPVEEVVALRDAGFDYIFNSSKWWNLSDEWALDQHEEFRGVAPSIAFPESHDTPRLAAETSGDEAVQRQRYALAAAYSAGVMMPVGYEYGFRKQVNVVETKPSDWERRHFDLRAFVTRVNRLKLRHPLLQGEGVLRAVSGLRGDVLVLERRQGESPDAPRGWIVVNKVWGEPRGAGLADLIGNAGGTDELIGNAGGTDALAPGYRLYRVCRDDAPEEGEPATGELRLDRAEVVYLLPDPGADA